MAKTGATRCVYVAKYFLCPTNRRDAWRRNTEALMEQPLWREFSRMATSLRPIVALIFAASVLAACGNTKPNPADPGYIGQEGPSSSGAMPGGSVLGDSSLIFGTGKDRPGSPKSGTDAGGGALGVNAYLW